MPMNALRALRKVLRRFENERIDDPPTSIWNFTVELEEDELDGGWIASVPELPGCMSQGETEAEAMENLADAVGGVVQARMTASLYRESAKNHPSAGRHRHHVAI